MSPTKGEAKAPQMFIEGKNLLAMAKDLRKVIEEASKSKDADKIALMYTKQNE